MTERRIVHSKAEADELVKKGYAIISIEYFVNGSQASYTLERGTDWSRKLGSK